MRIFLKIVSILFFALPTAFSKCHFRKMNNNFISLSGPVSVLLREVGLLRDPKLIGISLFAPIDRSEFSGAFYPGGIFLAPSIFKGFAGNIIFFDESQELNRILKDRGNIQALEFKSRDLLPLEVVEASIQIIRPFVLGCEAEFKKISERAIKLQDEIIQKIPKGLEVCFYLGEIRQGRFPELLIVNDGIVKLLIQKNIIKTYPTTLSYVNWSSKLMKTFNTSTLHVGISDSGQNKNRELKKNGTKMNLIYPGSLVPGLTQLEAFSFWVNQMIQQK